MPAIRGEKLNSSWLNLQPWSEYPGLLPPQADHILPSWLFRIKIPLKLLGSQASGVLRPAPRPQSGKLLSVISYRRRPLARTGGGLEN